MQRQPVKTDFSRPAGLPMATIRTNRQGLGGVEGTSDDYMKQLEEEWNRKIDDHIEVLTQNMQDLVDMAKIGNKDQFKVAQEAFQMELKAESMVLAATSLLSLTHSIKLMLLLSDEHEISETREQEIQRLRTEIGEEKLKAVQLWKDTMAPMMQEPKPETNAMTGV